MSKNFPQIVIQNYDPILDEVFSAREAEKFWGLGNGTIRAALNRGIITGRKSAGTWLVSRREMTATYGPQPSAEIIVTLPNNNSLNPDPATPRTAEAAAQQPNQNSAKSRQPRRAG